MVGANVISEKGDISVDVTRGYVTIGEALRADEGSISVHVGTAQAPGTSYGSDYDTEGGIYIGAGQTSEDRAVTAGMDASLTVGSGRIFVVGKTETGRDVTVEAGRPQYEPGEDSIVFDQDGSIAAGRNGSVVVTNGDIVVTHHVTAGNDLSIRAAREGSISFGESVSARGSLNLASDKGDILVNQAVTAENGSIGISIGDGTQGDGSITIGVENHETYPSGTGFTPYALKAGRDISLATSNGKVNVYGKTYAGSAETAGAGDLNVQVRSKTYEGSSSIIFGQYGELRSFHDTNINAVNGNLLIDSHFVTGNNLRASVLGRGSVTYQDVQSGGDLVSEVQNGNITGETIRAGGQVDLKVTDQGEIRFTDIVAKRVALQAPDDIAVRSIGVDANGSDAPAPDLLLSGRIIRVDRVDRNTAGSGANPGRITIALEGEGRDRRPIESVVIGNLASGAVVQNMWAKRGDITVTSGDLHVSKIYSEDKVTLRNGSLDIAVYGTTPRRDGERIVLWNNMFANSPAGDRAAWHSGSGSDKRWLTLDLNSGGGARVRYGVIVDYGDYVQLDRTSDSVVNQMRERLTDTPYRAATFEAISLFDRTPLFVTTPVLNLGSDRPEDEGVITIE